MTYPVTKRHEMRPGQTVALVHRVVAHHTGKTALHPTGQWVRLPKWKVFRVGSRWEVFDPTWGYLHTLGTFAEAIAWADREARKGGAS